MTWVQSLGREDLLEEGMATYSSTLTWRIPWTEEPGRLWSMKVKAKSLSCVQLFATPWTVAYQAPPSVGFSRQEYWSGLPFPSPEDLPDPGIKPKYLMFLSFAGGFFTTSTTWEAHFMYNNIY